MNTFEEVKNILAKHKYELEEKYGIREIGIFGSYIKNEQRKTSDIDILVEFSQESRITLLDFIHIENYLSDLLEIKVDLVEKSTLKPRISKNILKEVSYL
ncbi:MAG: nucleotidyltransferase family protein [Actinobacteria bacterium]|nr:nucleotidyltransferase family protein [Actinomycetota bacterium]